MIAPPRPDATADAERVAPASRPEIAAVRAAVVTPASLNEWERAAWRALLAGHAASAPFVDEAWVTAWRHGFRPCEPLLACAWERGELVGLGALQSRCEVWAGRWTTVIQSLTGVESPRFEFLSAGGRADVQERLCRALCTDGRWEVIRLEHLPDESPTLRAGLAVAAELGWSAVVEATRESPWRALPPAPEPWDEGLKRKFKANLRNRERRLQALGVVELTVARSEADQRTALTTFLTLEASGWKGARGTAIAQRACAKDFYAGLVARRVGDCWIPVLRVAGRAVAAQLILVHDRTLHMLKTAYDPAFSAYAPGHLLTARLGQFGRDRGMEVLDFLGDDMPWKEDWAPRLRRHHRLELFAPTAGGRYAHWTRYGIRELAKRIPGATRFVRRVRSLRKAAAGHGGTDADT